MIEMNDFKTITATAPAVLARAYGNTLIVTQGVMMAQDADDSLWLKFPSETAAREHFGIWPRMTNAQMLMGLGIQPNGGAT